jgi:PAS domain S-box-containing protein
MSWGMRGVLAAFGAACAVIAAASPAQALDPHKRITQYMHRAWGTQDGMPQNTVLALFQAPDGYLWLATQEGLGRFDGVAFTSFNKRNTPCLANHWITRMTPMPDGSAWLVPFHGAPVLLRDGVFHCDPLPAGLPADAITAIEPAADGGTWFASNQGLFLVVGDRVVRTYRGAPDDLLSSVLIRDLTLGRDGSLWIATDGGGVNRVSRSGAIEVFGAARGLSSDTVTEVIEARDGTIWAATAAGVDTIAAGHIAHVGAVPPVLVRTLIEDSRGALWFGTETGLFRLQGGRMSSYGRDDGLAGPIVGSLLEDREGNLWVGTFLGVDRGVDRFSDGLFTPYSTPEGLRDGQVWTVFEDAPGRMWVGTESGGLTRLQGESTISFGRTDGLGDDSVRSLFRDRTGTLWVGTYRVGARRWNGAVFEAVPSDDRRCDTNVVAIAEDAEGAVWIATKGLMDDRVGVLCRLQAGRFGVVDPGGGWKEDFFSCMFRTADGRLLVCSSNGLHLFRGTERTTYLKRDGLSSDFLLAAYQDADGVVWIGTGGGGLNRWKDGVFSHATTTDGLFDDTVFGVVEDERGNLWMSSNRGVFRVPKRDLDDLFAGRRRSIESTSYGTDDGMSSSECNGGSQFPVWRASDGRMWFATTKGAVAVDPRDLTGHTRPPPVLIEEFTADGKRRPLTGGIALEPGTRALEFNYTSTSLTSSERIRFQYRLDGFDADWVAAAGRRTAYYTNLPPGSYRFRVIAANSAGVWNQEGASITFELAPQFHQTWWFYASCGAIALSLVFAAHRVRVRHMRLREKVLEEHVAERTRRIAEAESYSRAIVGNVGEGIVTFDREGRISRWNGAAERIFAYTADEAVGKTAGMFGLSGGHEVDATAGPAMVEHARRKDGAVIPIEVLATEARIDGDSMTIWLVRDLTEARRAEAKVAAMQRELLVASRRAGMAQVATSVLHNVGNALTSVNLSADLVLDTLRRSRAAGLGKAVAMLPSDPAELACFLTETERGRHLSAYLTKVSNAIQQERETAIVELESMEKGMDHIKAIVSAQQSHARVSVDESVVVAELLDDALGLERSLCETANVAVRRDYGDLPLVRLDRHRLLEIVLNLLVNARESLCDPAVRGERAIALRTRMDGDTCFAIEVSDTGVGIAPENLVRIFNQGFTTKSGGHGFGLHGSSCAAIELGGQLAVHSDGVGAGARFTLTLPIDRAAQAPLAAAG